MGSLRLDCPYQEHVRQLAKRSAVADGGVDRLPGAKERRKQRPRETLDPIHSSDVDAVNLHPVKSCCTELTAKTARRREKLTQADKIANVRRCGDPIDEGIAIEVQERRGGHQRGAA